MSILSVLESQDLAGLLITLAAQSILIALFGVAAIKLLSGKSAPLRKLVCTGAIAALGLVLVISVGFRLSGIEWSRLDRANPLQESTTDSIPPPGQDLPIFFREIPLSSRVESAASIQNNGFAFPAPQSPSGLFRLPAVAILSINILGCLWLGGFLFQLFKLGYGVLLVRKFRSGLSKVSEGPFHATVGAIAATFWKNRLPELYTSSKIESPITIGLFNPVVIIPEKLYGNLSENELKSILLHELAHIYHYDHVIGVIKRVVLAAYWWNPLVYLINSEHELAGEEVSDNYVLHELHPKVYSRCLADLAEKVCLVGNYPSAAAMAGKRFSLGVRVEQILSKKRSIAMRTGSRIKTVVIVVCSVCILCVAGLQGQVETETTDYVYRDTQNTSLGTMSDTSPARLFFESQNLTPEKVAELETIVEQDPQDLRSRSMLLAYYMNRRSTDETAHNKTVQHALWFLENHPETEGLDVFLPHNNDEVAGLWQQQLDKYRDNLQVIYNAGNYFLIGYIDQAIDCYKLGKSLDPENVTKWDRKLGQAYQFKMMRSPESEKEGWADESLRAYENAYAEYEPPSFTTQAPGYPPITFEFPDAADCSLLPNMAKSALAAGDLDKVKDFANRMLSFKEDFHQMNMAACVYYGNWALGMIAMQNGDLDVAGEYLLAAGDASGSTGYIVPNMSLAKALLERDERDVVLAFLKKCPNFNTSKDIPFSRWIQEMEEGDTPDFSRYLNY